MEFLTQQVKVMIILAKYLNSQRRLPAFSLLEILTVLVIVGVILTLPRWPLIGSNLLNRVNVKIDQTQDRIDGAILAQSRPSTQKVISVSLKPICPSKAVQVYLGGWLMPTSIECPTGTLSISALGELRLENP